MAIPKGTRLGSYEVLELIGVGGMGEVYRANDTKLKREVALKVLPETFARDPERVARFRREAQLLASLNHTNIAAIYGVEHIDNVHFLVLELVPGETLRDLILRERSIHDTEPRPKGSGPISSGVPIEEALTICKQIAEALEHAHDKTVIHRDLKPANIKVTPEEKVKVLDFGLAKAFAGEGASIDPSEAPTVSFAPTIKGTIMGTPSYMSPEQARGRKADKRTDIWAFGCVLYELLTGKQAFAGEDITEILATVLKSEPDWTILPETTPASIRFVLRRCLEKELTRRFRDAADVRIQIEESASVTSSPLLPASIPAQPTWRRVAPFVLTALAAAVISGVAVKLNRSPVSSSARVARLSVPMPTNEAGYYVGCPAVAVSPDGSLLAYVTVREGKASIYLRPLDSLEAKPVAGVTTVADSLFFSPDGRWLAFWADGDIKKVSTSGGAPVTLATTDACGVSWGLDDNIIYSAGGSLWQIPASGGARRRLTTPDAAKREFEHAFPEFLPDAKAVLFTITTPSGSYDDAQIVVQRLDTGERKVLVRGGSHAHYVSTGHLIYARAGALLAAPFDVRRLEVTGAPVPVIEGALSPQGAAQFAISRNGSLIYIPGDVAQLGRELVWVDRKGMIRSLPAPTRPYAFPRLSPEGQRLAIRLDSDSSWWIYDLGRNTLTRLTFEGQSYRAAWTPDGKRLAYDLEKAGSGLNPSQGLFWKPADGSGPEERLAATEHIPVLEALSPDGKWLAFNDYGPDTATAADLWLLPLKGDPRQAGGEARKPRLFLQTAYNERAAVFSPDGRWLAYVSDESRREEVYVQPFPVPGGKWQISTEGGREPAWARNGRELFFRNGTKMMAVEVTTQPNFAASTPRMLFEGRFEFRPQPRANYDVSPDGQRFLMVKTSDQQQDGVRQLVVVLNWFEELKRRVPVGK